MGKVTKWHLSSKPYKVQLEALKSAEGKEGYAYFMEMGLGKTAVCWSEFNDLIYKDVVDFMIVVCPNSLKTNWMIEAEKQGVTGISYAPWPYIPEGVNIMMAINYEAISTKKGQKILSDMMQERSVYLVFDESIALKNPRAMRTKRAINLAKEAKVVRVLSGQPVTKSAMDLWGQLKVIGHVGTRNPYAFRNRFCIMGGYLGKEIVGSRNSEELEQILTAASFRAKKKEWTDLPDKSYSTRDYEMAKNQKEMYTQMHKDFVIKIEEGSITAPMAITQAMKLQQIGSGFIIDEEGNTHTIVPSDNNPKIKVVEEIVEQANSKVIVFAFYKRSVFSLVETFKDRCTFIAGGMSQQEIELAKFNFNEGDKEVIICQISSAKYGHTLLGNDDSPCYTSVYYENVYDLDARVQSEDRNHRHGQHHPVMYIDLLGNLMDHRIISALVKKQNVADAIMATTLPL